ncbi:MAG: hypothetical protein ACOC5T_05835 [Elusimicrobiota bacterium]
MILAILILQCVMILFLFIIGLEIVRKNYLQDNQKDLPNNLEDFKKGSNETWIAVVISLYKMWNDLDILDFDSLQGKLHETISNLTKDPREFEKWSHKFNNYMKDKYEDGEENGQNF